MTGANDAGGSALSSAQLHDLRTPLGQIIGYAELLAERAQETGDERFTPDLQKISAAGYRMLALIEEIFTAARADAPAAFTWDDVDALRALAAASPPEDAERLASISARIAALLPPRG
ncbi:MAG TPA: histidine kinase dimerization/phospho-acceptor domain-containing protein [Longimicrobium sp.]|jgi:signal transduction histidine kinase